MLRGLPKNILKWLFKAARRRTAALPIFKIIAMMKKWLLAASLTFLSGLVFFSCKKDTNDDTQPVELDRKPMLINYADHYILPAYAAMSDHLSVLKAKADAFTAAPDVAGLTALRTAWKEAYLTWQTVDPDRIRACRRCFATHVYEYLSAYYIKSRKQYRQRQLRSRNFRQ